MKLWQKYTFTIAILSSTPLFAVVTPRYAEIKTSNQLMSETTHRYFKRVQSLMDKESYLEALSELTKLEQRLSKRQGDVAKINQYKGFILAQSGSYNEAIDAFKKAIDSGGLDKSTAIHSLEILGQLYMTVENHLEAAAIFASAKLHKPELNANTLAAMASNFAHLKNHDEALKHISAAITQSPQPNKNWYELQVALYFEKKEFGLAQKALLELIKNAPEEKKYWQQLVTASLAGGKEPLATAILKNADLLQILEKEQDLLQLVQLQTSVGEPFHAASRLERALAEGKVEGTKRTYQFLAQSWMDAKEFDKAIAAYSKAALHDASGEMDLLRAQLLLEQENWNEAKKSIQLSLKKLGDAEKKAKAHLLLGIACIHSQEKELAKSYLSQAITMEKYKAQAEAWLTYLN